MQANRNVCRGQRNVEGPRSDKRLRCGAGQGPLSKEFLVVVPGVQIVVQIKTERSECVGGAGPLVKKLHCCALALEDLVCLRAIEFDQTWPGPVIGGNSGSIAGGAGAKIPVLIKT